MNVAPAHASRLFVPLALVASFATPVHAQVARNAVVAVFVTDTSGSPLGNVEVFIVRQGVGAVVGGRSDTAGRQVLRFERDTGRYSVVARRVGFAATQLQVPDAVDDTLRLTLRLLTLPATELPSVRIAAAPPGKNYFLDSTAIARSGRVIDNAYHALSKLRPDMLGDRGRCRESVDNVWINGRRILWMARTDPHSFSSAATTTRGSGGRLVIRVRAKEPPVVDSVLASIRAEHIAEVRYVNCWDTSMRGMGTNNAIYIILKPGIDWDWGRGSFVALGRN